jgi:hypothetical protein
MGVGVHRPYACRKHPEWNWLAQKQVATAFEIIGRAGQVTVLAARVLRNASQVESRKASDATIMRPYPIDAGSAGKVNPGQEK